MVTSPILLFRDGTKKQWRAPDTAICLHCPLPECCIAARLPADIRRQPAPPACPVEFAIYHRVSLATAEWLAQQTLVGDEPDDYRNWAYRSVVRQTAERARWLQEMEVA